MFGINIAKAYVTMPAELREQLDPLVSQVTRRADQRYRSGDARGTGRSSANGRPVGGRRGGPRAGQGLGPAGGSGEARSPGLGVGTRRAIEDAAASAGEKQALARIIAALTERYPEVARDLGW